MQESFWHKFSQNPLSGYEDIFIFTFCASFSNSKWRHSWNAKLQKSIRHHTRNILAKSWINFNQWFLIYRHLCVYAIFNNGPWWPSWIVNLHKFKIVSYKQSKRLYTGNILAQGWINFIQWFLRYCYFRVCSILSNSPWWPSWIVSLHKYEMVPFRDHCDQIWPKYSHVFLRYWHLSETGLVNTK